MGPIIWLLDTLLSLLFWAILIGVVASWLVAFNVINPHNQFVRAVLDTINRITEPLCRPIRRILPDLGGIDFSPMIVLLLIQFVRMYLY